MLAFLKKIFEKDMIFYGLLSIVIILLAQLPVILHWLQTPSGYYYPFIDRPSFSEYYYLALIRFGMEGGWLTSVPYVVSPHQGSFIQILFVLMGKIGNIAPLGPAEIYALFRIIGGGVLLISAVILLRLLLLKNQARLAFILFLLIQPIPFLNRQYLLPGYFEDFDHFVWHFGEAARRVSMTTPHYTLGKGLAVFSLVFLILFLRKKKVRFAICGGIVGFLAGIIYPPPVFILLFSMGLALPFVYLLNKRVDIGFNCHAELGSASLSKMGEILKQVQDDIYNRKFLIYLLPVVLIPLGYLLALLLLQYEVGKGYPWNMWNRVELGWNDPSMHFEWSYIHMTGIFLLFIPLGLVKIWKEKDKRLSGLFLTLWGLSAFMLFPFANVLHVGKFRFTEGLQMLPLAILGAWGMENLITEKDRIQHVYRAIIGIIIFYFLFWSFFSTQWSIARIKGWFTNVYFRPQELQALKFLQRVPKDSVVLADQYPSNFIPAFSRVRTIIGFSDFYPSYDDFTNEKTEIEAILSEKKSMDATKKYLQDHHVQYIYREVDPNQKTSNYYKDILEKVFDNGSFEIYRVNEN